MRFASSRINKLKLQLSAEEVVQKDERSEILAEGCPTSFDEISSSWLSALMQTKVASFVAEKLDAGVLSDAARLTITYEDGEPDNKLRPAICILKFCKEDEANRLKAMEIDAYRKEMDFYEQLHDQMPLRVPKPFGTFRHPSKSHVFALLMEDMRLEHHALSQLEGITAEETLAMARLLGQMHGRFFEHSILDQPGMTTRISGKFSNHENGEYRLPFNAWLDNFPQCWAPYAALLAENGLDVDLGMPELARVNRNMCRPEVADRMFRRWWRVLHSRPRTLVHGDLRADNLWRNRNTGKMAVIDWQTYHSGPGGCDFEQLLGPNGATPEAHAVTSEAFDVYHEALVAHGPPGIGEAYTVEMVRDDYLISTFMFLFGLAGGMEDVLRESPTDSHIWKLFLDSMGSSGSEKGKNLALFRENGMCEWWFKEAKEEGVVLFE
jgi:hypothetical protein